MVAGLAAPCIYYTGLSARTFSPLMSTFLSVNGRGGGTGNKRCHLGAFLVWEFGSEAISLLTGA